MIVNYRNITILTPKQITLYSILTVLRLYIPYTGVKLHLYCVGILHFYLTGSQHLDGTRDVIISLLCPRYLREERWTLITECIQLRANCLRPVFFF